MPDHDMPDAIKADLHAALDRAINKRQHMVLVSVSDDYKDLNLVSTTSDEEAIHTILMLGIASRSSPNKEVEQSYSENDIERKQ